MIRHRLFSLSLTGIWRELLPRINNKIASQLISLFLVACQHLTTTRENFWPKISIRIRRQSRWSNFWTRGNPFHRISFIIFTGRKPVKLTKRYPILNWQRLSGTWTFSQALHSLWRRSPLSLTDLDYNFNQI
jgi:hypothetical protein